MIREILGKKIGMTQVFTSEGDLEAVTLVEVKPVRILEKVDYANKSVARVGIFELPEAKKNKVKKPVMGYFSKLNSPAYSIIKEIPVASDADFSFLNSESTAESESSSENAEAESSSEADAPAEKVDKRYVGVDLFSLGEVVDVSANTKGRGFAGGMKRHNWSGQPGSHGSTMHRRLGSAGANSSPAKIWKGLGMPGRMGNWKRTVKNLKIVKVDREKCLLFIRGAVPGARGTVVTIIKT